jgi:DNA repair exonuclease SbcCD nuclease subunit
MKKLLKVPLSSPFDIQPDSIVFSDLHLHERKEFDRVDDLTGLNTRLVEGIEIVKQIIDILNAHPEIRYIYFLGDPFELKDKVPNHILIEFQNLMDKIEQTGAKLTAVLGNHDFNLPKYPTIKLFDLHLVIDTQTYTRDDGVKLGFIPFKRNLEDFIIDLKKVNDQNPDIVFFHQELPGVSYETGKKIGGIFPQTLFNSNSLYISGHIHKHQTVGKALYVGSPYQTKFSDEGQTRFIWLLNGKTKKYAPIKLHYPEFKSLDIQTHKGTILSETSLESISGNYIRVVGEIEASQWDLQTRKEVKAMLERAGAKGVSFQVQIVKQRQAQIPADKVDDDKSIIRLFVDNNFNDSNLDKNEILKIGIELFETR